MRALLDAIPDLMFRITADGTYLDFVGDADLLANPSESVVGGKVDELLPPHVARPLMATIHEALESGKLQTSATCSDDARRRAPVRGAGRADRRQRGRHDRRDATELRQTERELRAAHDRLVSARDAERRRLEREPPRRCAAAADRRPAGAARGVVPAACGQRRRRRAPPRAEEQLALGITEMRELARGLHPSALTEDGLGAALQQLVTRSSRSSCRSSSTSCLSRSSPSSRRARTTSSPRRSPMPRSTPAPRRRGCGRSGVDAITVEIADDGCGGACATPGGGSRASPNACPRSAARWRSRARRARGRRCARRSPPAASLLSDPRQVGSSTPQRPLNTD